MTFIIVGFIASINLFLKINSNINHIIGINIILGIFMAISLINVLIVNRKFKKLDFSNHKVLAKNLKAAFANAFFASSIFSIISACVIYGFLKDILDKFNLSDGVINYCVFAAKIWFISSPFIGLEIVVFKYFSTLEYFNKPILILILKALVFVGISLIEYRTRNVNCFIYAKPICDVIFLPYYSKICFGITIFNKA